MLDAARFAGRAAPGNFARVFAQMLQWCLPEAAVGGQHSIGNVFAPQEVARHVPEQPLCTER
eukprot:8427735-Alexandrium_andersonii.AAC.1